MSESNDDFTPATIHVIEEDSTWPQAFMENLSVVFEEYKDSDMSNAYFIRVKRALEAAFTSCKDAGTAEGNFLLRVNAVGEAWEYTFSSDIYVPDIVVRMEKDPDDGISTLDSLEPGDK